MCLGCIRTSSTPRKSPYSKTSRNGLHLDGDCSWLAEDRQALELQPERRARRSKKITAAGAPIMKLSAKEPETPKDPKSGKEKYSAKKSKEDEAKTATDLAAGPEPASV
jgi:hypothetical protein